MISVKTDAREDSDLIKITVFWQRSHVLHVATAQGQRGGLVYVNITDQNLGINQEHLS